MEARGSQAELKRSQEEEEEEEEKATVGGKQKNI